MITHLQPLPLDPATNIAVRQLQAQINELGKQLRTLQEERAADSMVTKAVLIALPVEVSLDHKVVYKSIEEAQLPGWSASVKEKAMKRAEGLMFVRNSMMHRLGSGKL